MLCWCRCSSRCSHKTCCSCRQIPGHGILLDFLPQLLKQLEALAAPAPQLLDEFPASAFKQFQPIVGVDGRFAGGRGKDRSRLLVPCPGVPGREILRQPGRCQRLAPTMPSGVVGLLSLSEFVMTAILRGFQAARGP